MNYGLLKFLMRKEKTLKANKMAQGSRNSARGFKKKILRGENIKP